MQNTLTAAKSAGQTIDAARLHRVLRDATRRWRVARVLSFAMTAIAWCIAALLVAILLDAALGLPTWGLLVLDTALITLAVALLISLLLTATRTRHDPRRAAVAIEQSGATTRSGLINALDFSTVSVPDDHARGSTTLRALAVNLGVAAGDQLDRGALIDRPALRRAALALLAVSLVFSAGWLAMPRVFAAVGPRLLHPTANHPPYTRLQFGLNATGIDSETIHVGQPATLQVTITAGHTNRNLPTEAQLVILDSANNPPPVALFLTTPPHETANPETANEESNAAPPRRFTTRFEAIARPMRFYIDTPAGRSRVFTLAPDTTPLFASLHVTVTPPDYTGFKPTTQRLTVEHPSMPTNSIRAFRGSAITLTAASNVPLEAVVVLRGEAASEQRFAGGGASLTRDALLIVEESYNAALQLVGRDGKTSDHAAAFEVVALEDQPPSVSIHSPAPIALAVVGYPVPIHLVAKDDVGLASVMLYVEMPRQDVLPRELVSSDADVLPTKLNVKPIIDLAELDAQPGDVIRYFAAARDNRPPGSVPAPAPGNNPAAAPGNKPAAASASENNAGGAGQRVETPVQEIQVISQERWDEIARTQYGLDQMQAELDAIQEQLAALAEARAAILEAMKPLQEKAAAGEALTDAERQQLRELQEQLDAFAQEARDLAAAMEERAGQPSLYDFEEPFKKRLKELAEQLEQQADQAQAARDAAEPLANEGEKDPSLPGGLPGIKPTEAQQKEFAEQAKKMAEQGEPFDEQTREEMEKFEEDLWKLELAEEMLFHAERIRQVIEQQRDVEARLGELRWRDASQLTEADAQRLDALAERESELREELEDAALMLRESAEMAGPLLPMMSGTSVMLTEKLWGLEVDADLERAAALAGGGAGAAEPGLAHAAAEVAADKLESLLSEAGQMSQSAESDLDQALSLPKAGMQKSLQQMAGARAAAMAAGTMPGGQGGGSAGSAGTAGAMGGASLIGPRAMGGGPGAGAGERDEAGRSNRAAPGDSLDPESGSPETLNPDSTDTRGQSSLALPGVPARYQDVAAAYFQRLADEAARIGE